MDKGIHVGSWSQLQEWKVDMDSPTDVHRHLSHLIGLYPGYSISFYDPALQGRDLTRRKVLEAAEVSLEHRGNGTGRESSSSRLAPSLASDRRISSGRKLWLAEGLESGVLGSTA